MVEVAGSVKKGGTPVNIEKGTVDIVRRMGLLDHIRSHRLMMQLTEFKNSDDVTESSQSREASDDEFEIERDVLLHLLLNSVQGDVHFMFGDTVTTLTDEGDRVDVEFKRAGKRSFDLVFGCDGIHSIVRRLCFGAEAGFMHFLQAYFSITIVNKLLIPQNTTQMYNEPGKMAMLNAYNGKTDVVLCFASDQEIPYDYRNEEQQRQLILNHFSGVGWRTAEMLEEVKQSKTVYFDRLCQIKLPSWTKGRVALVGDAGYCASPAAGKGGSLAIDGAAALADAFHKCDGDFALAFEEYNRRFRPYIEEVQSDVLTFGLEMILPRTEEAIRLRNTQTQSSADAPRLQ